MGLTMNRNPGANLDSRSWLGAAGHWVGKFFDARPDDEVATTLTQTSKLPALTAPELAGLRIMVAEDDPRMRRLASQAFAELGVSPLFAGDGAEAVALACGIEFDLILMDPGLRVLSGLAATSEIREFEAQHRRARVPVVAYSHGVPGARASLFESYGIDATLEKPCSAQALRQCLSSLVVRARPEDLRYPSRRGDAVSQGAARA